MGACDELILVNFFEESWIQRFLPLNISPEICAVVFFMDACDELIQ